MNVVAGGTLFQDLKAQHEGALDHEQPNSPAEAGHELQLESHTPLGRALKQERFAVNSTHHQAVETLGEDFQVWGRAEDGVIELIANPKRKFWVGAQWHPELLADGLCDWLYGALVRSARASGARRV